MKFKSVMRWDPSWPKLRLFRVVWDGGAREFMAGTQHATTVVGSNKLAVALRPRLFRFERGAGREGWRLVVCGVEVHRETSWGGRFA